jgi:hypothetical protein
MTDHTKAIVWDAVYTPFGQVHSITGTATNNQRFPGQYADAETGYSYNYFRDYDPTTGRYGRGVRFCNAAFFQLSPLAFFSAGSLFFAGFLMSRILPPHDKALLSRQKDPKPTFAALNSNNS